MTTGAAVAVGHSTHMKVACAIGIQRFQGHVYTDGPDYLHRKHNPKHGAEVELPRLYAAEGDGEHGEYEVGYNPFHFIDIVVEDNSQYHCYREHPWFEPLLYGGYFSVSFHFGCKGTKKVCP